MFKFDFDGEYQDLKKAVGEIVDEKVAPEVRGSISQLGTELSNVITKAGIELEANIKVLSEEIHNQRRLTREEIIELVNDAAKILGKTIDERVAAARQEASILISEKIAIVRVELEDAAVRSRKTLWINIAFSVGAAVAMAVVGLVYRKITLGELDVFWLFRVLLLSAATGTGLFAALKTFNQWHTMNKAKKNAITIAISYMGAFRPNGATGLFLLSLLLVVSWFILAFYIH